jgi:hypothetical protein
LRHYAAAQEQTVLPRFVRPRVLTYLWLLLGLLTCGAAVAWLARVPIYASGPAAVVALSGKDGGGRIAVVAFLPPQNLARVHVGQALLLSVDATGSRLVTRIVAVDPGASSPSALQRRFALTGAAAAIVTQPAGIVLARLDAVPGHLPASAYVGSVFRADIAVGSRRVMALVPIVGRWVDGGESAS